ncbi:MAG: hypothetical protein RLZZ326_1999 [Planctomycetota bacterium]|jgi:hypothetical protein
MDTPSFFLAVTKGDLTQWDDLALDRRILRDSDRRAAAGSSAGQPESRILDWFVIGHEHFAMRAPPITPEQEEFDNPNHDPLLLITPSKKNRRYDIEAARALARALLVADAACQCRCFESEMKSGKQRWRPFK